MTAEHQGMIRVALASDGSPDALEAAAFIADRLSPSAISCTVLTVVERNWDKGGGDHEAPVDAEKSWALPAARRTALRLHGIPVTIRILYGDAVREVLRELRDHPSDLLVVGHRGAHGMGGRVMGSVSQALVHYAPVPVLVIPPPPTSKATGPASPA